MKLANILPVMIAGAHAMHIPSPESEGALQKRDNFAGTSDDTVIPGHYIVVLRKGQDVSAYKALDEWFAKHFSELKAKGSLSDSVSDKVEFFNVLSFMGYTGYLPPTLLDTVKKDPLVDFVEADQICEMNKFAEQKGAPWGIARISQRANKKVPDYDYDDQAGKGVTAYVVDSGIKVEHPDFEGRARWGINIANPGHDVDEVGHGTHVAGILGGKTYGIAKKVQLVAVAVFGASKKASASKMIKGIEYSVNDYQAAVKAKKKGYKGATINMSVTNPPSTALDLAVNAAMDAGVHVIVSVGNKNQDACNFSPARALGPITVGATDINDVRAPYSNFGKCVDVQAPGTDILSCGIHLPTAVKSGTSMAAPHVAGIISTFVSLQPGVGSDFNVVPVTPKDLKRKFLGFSTRAVVTGLDKDTVNKFAYNGAGLSLKDLWIL